MNTQPLLIDNIAFAKRNEHLSGTLHAADCPRLLELIAAQAMDPKATNSTGAGVIEFTLDGETNTMCQHFLHLSIAANLNTHCQRSLEPMPLRLNLNFDYLVDDFNVQDSDAADLEDSDDVFGVAKQLIGENTNVDKEYLVRVEYTKPGRLPDSDLQRLNHGLWMDGKPLLPAKVRWQNDDQLSFTLREGKKRQIRRMCEMVGLRVVGLKRVRIGRVKLGNLPEGQWRYLSPDERF